MQVHSPFDNKYWNLAQACAWVEYREMHLVDELAQADRSAYMAIGMYPSMWPAGREQYGRIEDLRRALEGGQLASSGFRRGGQERLEDIPAAEWVDYVIRPPLISFLDQPQNIPWTNFRVLSADMKRLWRSDHELSGRSKFDWTSIKSIYDKLKTQNPRMSQNELILELQGSYEERFNKDAPARSTIQNKIKIWS